MSISIVYFIDFACFLRAGFERRPGLHAGSVPRLYATDKGAKTASASAEYAAAS